MPNAFNRVYVKVLVVFSLYCLTVVPAKAQQASNEILWDTYGVPHVFAASLPGMYYGFGWAQMHNHANLILRLYGQARGRAAEYWGEKYLPSDKEVHLLDIPSIARRDCAEQNKEFSRYLIAFVKGMNDYAIAHPEAIDADNKQVLPLTPEDPVAHGIRVIFLRFAADEDLNVVNRLGKPGSNALAIGPERSASKNAMLVTNPHLPWFDLFTFFEAHLQAPGFDAYGVALVGMPVLNIAFNQHLGWTHTVNPIDISDRYELTLRDSGYVLDGVVLPFKNRTIMLKVRLPDGKQQEYPVTFRYSRHGPVVTWKSNKAYAIRIAGLENRNVLFQWHKMAAAQNWEQFEMALKMMQLPILNVVYADEKGHIFYLFDGNLPRRSTGNWDFWHGTVDGSNSKLIWQQTLSYVELPKLFDPATGFIQNANDPPWNCTFPARLNPSVFPVYMAPQQMELRPQRAVNMMKADSSITFEELIACKLNTEMEAADRLLGELLALVKRYPDPMAAKAAEVLAKWDKTTDSSSRGAVLFARWYDKIDDSMFEKPWNPLYPVSTPSGLKYPAAAVRLLSQAADEVARNYGSLDIAWGEVYRFRTDGQDYPANGGASKYGIFRTFYYRPDKDKKFRAIAGDSYVAVTEFGKNRRARVLLSYGNASQPGSKHAGDQLLLLSRKELRPALLKKKDILQHLEQKEELVVKP